MRRAVCDYDVALLFKFFKVFNYFRIKKIAAAVRRFVDDDPYALRFDALHNALNRRLTEIIAVRFHRQTVHADRLRLFCDYPIGDKIFARLVRFDDRAD